MNCSKIFKGLHVVGCVLLTGIALAAEDPGLITVRARNFLVPPSSGPVTTVMVRNAGVHSYRATVSVLFPEGWQVSPSRQPVDLEPGETKPVPITVKRAIDRAANIYPLAIILDGPGGRVVRQQGVCCASTPYYEPKIDGDLKEWTDAIPISFATVGKKTIVRSYWNRNQFCLAAEVEEDKLISLKKSSSEAGLDAVQFAVAPSGVATGGADGNTSVRYEFLVADSGSVFGRDRCYQLSKPGLSLDPSRKARPLEPLLFEDAEVSVKRKSRITYYEIAIPFVSMPELRPAPGREYAFSLLVHDPDGTGLRDLGQVMNLTDQDRHPLAWTSWEYARWTDKVPFDNKVEFGFCSSIH